MAITLIIKSDSKELLKFKTEEIHEEQGNTGDLEPQLYARVTICNEDLKDLSDAAKYKILVSEELFHKDLRGKAALYGTLITSHSTNPEWNPSEYSKTLEEALP